MNPPIPFWNRKNRSFPSLLVLAAILLSPYAAVLIHPDGRILGDIHSDSLKFFYPIYHFTGSSWRAGEVPLWNPYIMLGLPFLAEGQGAAFHPFSILFVLLPTGPAINWMVALCFLVSGLAVWGYLRSLDLSRQSSFCGALIWCFSSALIGRIYAGHFSMLLGCFSLPLLLMLWERYRASQKAAWLVAASAVYACLNFAGYPMYTFTYSLFILLYIMLQCGLSCTSKRQALQSIRAAALFGLFLLFGAGMAAVQLLPTLEFAGQSFRGQPSTWFSGTFSFAPENFLTALCPRFFGAWKVEGPDQYWGRGYLWETWIYVGILPLIAAATGAMAAPRRQKAALLGSALIFLILALGKHTPLFPLLYRYVPFFSLFRAPSRYLLVTQFCLVTLAAYGLERWFRKPCGLSSPTLGRQPPSDQPVAAGCRDDTAKRPRVAGLGTALLILGFLCVPYLVLIPNHGAPGSRWQALIGQVYAQGEALIPAIDYRDGAVLAQTGDRAAAQLTRAMLLTALTVLVLFWMATGKKRSAVFPFVVIVLLVDLGSFFFPFLLKGDEASLRYPKAIAEHWADARSYPPRVLDISWAPNRAILYRVSSVGGYAGSSLLRYNNFLNAALGLDGGISHALATGAGLPPRYWKTLAVEYCILPDSQQLIELPDSFPRAFLAESPQRFDSPQEALRYVCDLDSDLFRNPAVETLNPASIAAGPIEESEKVEFLHFSPNRVVLETLTRRPRLLILNEMYDSQWSATVNDQEAQVYPANYLFRAVRVPEGRSTVVFTYRPVSFRLGIAVSLISGLLVVVFWFLLARGEKDSRRVGLPDTTAVARST